MQAVRNFVEGAKSICIMVVCFVPVAEWLSESHPHSLEE